MAQEQEKRNLNFTIISGPNRMSLMLALFDDGELEQPLVRNIRFTLQDDRDCLDTVQCIILGSEVVAVSLRVQMKRLDRNKWKLFGQTLEGRTFRAIYDSISRSGSLEYSE